jgi:hypothetical protein
MSRTGIIGAIGDRIFLFFNTAVRVRVWFVDGKPQTSVRGRSIRQYTPEKLRDVALEMKPQADGVVDFRSAGGRSWEIRVRGPLADDGYDQRLRNFVMNTMP